MHISIQDEEARSLLFDLEEGHQIKLQGSHNLISCFKGLSALYVSERLSISSHAAVGILLGNDESADKFCGAVIPLQLLCKICQDSLSFESLKLFFRVCQVLNKSFSISLSTQSSSSRNKPDRSTNAVASQNGIELPANFIWILWVLSELFDVSSLKKDCINKLKKLLNVDNVKENELNSKLPPSLVSGIDASLAEELATNLRTHFSKFSDEEDEEEGHDSTDEGSSASSECSEKHGDLLVSPTKQPTSVFSNTANAIPKTQLDDSPSNFTDRSDMSQRSGTNAYFMNQRLQEFATQNESQYIRPQYSEEPRVVLSSSRSLHRHDDTQFNNSHRAHDSLRSSDQRVFSKSKQRSISPTSTRWNISTKSPDDPSSLGKMSIQELKSSRGLADSSMDMHKTTRTFSPEDLKLSREIALLRLREVKIKEELEASKRLAEQNLRESRLKALHLKTSVLRNISDYQPHSSSSRRPSPHQPHRMHYYSSGSDPGGFSDSRTRSSSAPRLRVSPSTQHSPLRPLSSNGRHQYALLTRDDLAREAEVVEEARMRAIQRIKQKKLEDARLLSQQLAVKQKEKPSETLSERDQSMTKFKEMSRTVSGAGAKGHTMHDSSSSSSTSVNRRSFNAPSSRYDLVGQKDKRVSVADVDDVGDNRGNDNAIVTSGLYTKEALAAVGLGWSPSVAAASEATAVAPDKAIEAKEVLSIKVLRAWDLMECLGGTNAYVVISIAGCGEACTQAIHNSTSPYFGSLLQFKSPYSKTKHRYSGQNNPVEDRDEVFHVARIMVYSRNPSISDELIALADLELPSVHRLEDLSISESRVVYLQDAQSHHSAGCLELALQLNAWV